MATTVQDILTAGLSRSTKNKADVIASSSTEMVKLIDRLQRQKYALGARVNPTYFGATIATAWNGSNGWNRPTGAETVFRIEKAGAEVVVVPYDDRAVDTVNPAVFPYGGVYHPAGYPNDPTSADTLTIYYGVKPVALTSLSDTLDATWPDQFNELLALEVAIYLAIKDGRTDEAQTLYRERKPWIRMFVAFLEHETIQTRRRFTWRQNTSSDTEMDLAPMLDADMPVSGGDAT